MFAPIKTVLFSFVAMLGLPGLSLAQEGATSAPSTAEPQTSGQEQALLDQIKQAQSDLGVVRQGVVQPMAINGQALDPLELKREVLYLIGGSILELKILEFITDEWKTQLIREGKRDAGDLEITDADVEAKVREGLQEFTVKYPEMDFWEVVRAQTGISKDRYLHQTKVSMMFENVFMPGPADEWPSVTVEAIKSGSSGQGGEDFWKGMVKNSRDKDGNPMGMPPIWKDMIRRLLVTQLKAWSDIKYPSQGLPADIALSVNDKTWSVEDAYSHVEDGLFLQDLETAVNELVVREALKQELVKNDTYLNDEDFKRMFQEYREKYDGTMFSTEMIARAFKGYPTFEAFRARWRLVQSYENMIADELTDEALQAYANEKTRFFANGSVRVEVISFLGKDPKTAAWLPNGVENAKKRADKCMEELRNGADYDEMLESRGEYLTADKERGRLGGKSLNELRRSLKESEYLDLLQGYSISEYMFYDAPDGEAVGPIRGPEGYFIARANGRTGGTGKTVSVQDKGRRELVKQDYVMHRFQDWANEVIGKTKVDFLPPGK